jgi:hypothetical protein
MSQSFDYHAFDQQSASILVHSKGKTFAQLAVEIKELRQEYERIRDTTARKYIRRDLDRRLLMFAIDTSQPCVVVDRLYNRNVRQGFNGPHAEVASAIEYADYYSDRGDPTKGLRALYKVRETVCASQGIAPGREQNFLQPIEESIRRLEETR